jgi:hypothetical protein
MQRSLRLLLAVVPVALLACSASTPEAPPPAADEPAADKAADPADNPADQAAASKGLAGLAEMMGKKPPAPWKFDFKDPGPGPRAPTTQVFGATIGTSMFPEIEKHVQALGLTCGDTSIRAMMDRRREAERAKIAEAKARGEDAVTAASWLDKRSKREQNPQLRFSCPKVTSDQIKDRPRPPSSGRLLFVFDDPSYPVRHASYQRTHKDHAAALADHDDTLAALTKVYGPPTTPAKAGLPRLEPGGKVEFPTATNFETSWEYADLVVRLNVLRYSDLVTVGERIEVPHGLRPDAPRIAAGAAGTAPTTPATTTTTTPPTTTPPAAKAAAPAPAAAGPSGA